MNRIVSAGCIVPVCLILTACAPPSPVAITPAVVRIYSTSAADPWLKKSYDCANQNALALNFSAQDPALMLRIGEPRTFDSAAYQIGEEQIFVVVPAASPLQLLTRYDAEELFAGRGDANLNTWVYSADDDVQTSFDALVMKGAARSSLAQLASSPANMIVHLSADANAVGILPAHALTDSLRSVYSAGSVPVLAIVRATPSNALTALLACLQNN